MIRFTPSQVCGLTFCSVREISRSHVSGVGEYNAINKNLTALHGERVKIIKIKLTYTHTHTHTHTRQGARLFFTTARTMCLIKIVCTVRYSINTVLCLWCERL